MSKLIELCPFCPFAAPTPTPCQGQNPIVDKATLSAGREYSHLCPLAASVVPFSLRSHISIYRAAQNGEYLPRVNVKILDP